MYLWKPESSDLGELELEVVVSHPKQMPGIELRLDS